MRCVIVSAVKLASHHVTFNNLALGVRLACFDEVAAFRMNLEAVWLVTAGRHFTYLHVLQWNYSFWLFILQTLHTMLHVHAATWNDHWSFKVPFAYLFTITCLHLIVNWQLSSFQCLRNVQTYSKVSFFRFTWFGWLLLRLCSWFLQAKWPFWCLTNNVSTLKADFKSSTVIVKI